MSGTITPPHSYSEWASIIDMLEKKVDDEPVLYAMQQGTIEWQSGVAERFSKRLINAVNHRMNLATDKFQRDMSHSHGQEREIVQALISLRKEFRFLSQVFNLPAIPEKERAHYCQLVLSQADSIQESLEESAKKDRSGKLSSIIRNNRVNSF